MIHRSPELSSVSTVCLGSFNPKIFQPAWLAAQNLIREEEADEAEIGIVHPDVVAFSVGWLRLEVQRERLALASTPTTEANEAVRDVLIGLLTILSHTPVSALGINAEAHFPTDQRDEFDRLGWALVSPAPWSEALQRPGVRSVTVEGIRPDDFDGFVRVTVEPSLRVEPYAVYMSVNDHYQLAQGSDGSGGTEAALDVLRQCWDGSMSRAETVFDEVLTVE